MFKSLIVSGSQIRENTFQNVIYFLFKELGKEHKHGLMINAMLFFFFHNRHLHTDFLYSFKFSYLSFVRSFIFHAS